MTVMLDKNLFIQRLKRLYSMEFGIKDYFDKIDYFSCVIEKYDRDVTIYKSAALMLWLLDFHLLDTITIFGKENIYFVSNKRRLKLLRSALNDTVLMKIKTMLNINIKFVELYDNKSNEDIFFKIIGFMSQNVKFHRIGIFNEVSHKIDTCLKTQWQKCLHKTKWEPKDYIDDYVSYLMSVKTQKELTMVKKACRLSIDAYQRCLDLIYNNLVIEKNNASTIRHIDIANHAFTIIVQRQELIKGLYPIDIAYEPIIQSGGVYTLSLETGSNENQLKDDIIILSFGFNYYQYCGSITRTEIMHDYKDALSNYLFLIDIQRHVINLLQDGVKLSEVYDSTILFVKEKNRYLLDYLTENFGSVIGMELEDEYLTIKQNAKAICKKNMTFNVIVGLTISDSNDVKSPFNTYSLWVGDVVKVNKGKPATILIPLCE